MAEVASLGQKQWETICSETCPGNHDDEEDCMVVIMNAMMMIILVKTCSLCKNFVQLCNQRLFLSKMKRDL